MYKTKLAIFDLSGTTVEDDNAVAKSLYKAAKEHGLNVSLEDFEKSIGTNKIHLYQYMIAKTKGQNVKIEDFEKYEFPEILEEAMLIFNTYTDIMISYYKENIRPIEGTESVFKWLRDNDIKIATDTGFHSDVNNAIMEGLGWLIDKKIDISINVETTNGVGRPAPFMIYKAMELLGIQNVKEVIKIGDTPADLLSGENAACGGNIGVLSGANSINVLGKYKHTHILNDINELPEIITKDFT